jgi:hypothetical protein
MLFEVTIVIKFILFDVRPSKNKGVTSNTLRKLFFILKPVWGIQDVYPGSDFFPSWIPDPNCLHPRSRILVKEFKYFNPKKAKKWFLSSKKYDPGCSSQIPDPDADSPIPDPGSRGQKGTQSQIRIRNTV